MNDFKTAIATHANSFPRAPSANDKLAAINYLVEAMDPANKVTFNGEEPALFKALATLYSQHLPSTPAKPKTAFAWCAKAIAKKDIRHYLQSANVLDGVLRCTDGHRVHTAPTKLDNGHYDRAGVKLSDEGMGTFPDVNRVIPGHTGKDRVVFNAEHLTFGKIIKAGKLDAIEVRLPSPDSEYKGCYINLKYLKDAMSNPSPVDVASYGPNGLESVYITFKDGSSATIMPMRV